MKKTQQIRTIRILTAVLVFCVLVAAAAIAILLTAPRKPASPYFGQHDPAAPNAYAFRLTDHNGKPWSLDEQRGNVVLLNFGFTRCPNICPTTLANLAAVLRELPPEAQARVRVAFVSVDERDTPETLKNYVPFFNERFIGLTGNSGEIGTVARAYGASFRKAPPAGSDKSDYLIDHSTYTTLIDPEGKSRLLYRFEQMPESKRIAADILRLLGMPGPQ